MGFLETNVIVAFCLLCPDGWLRAFYPELDGSEFVLLHLAFSANVSNPPVQKNKKSIKHIKVPNSLFLQVDNIHSTFIWLLSMYVPLHLPQIQ